MLNHGHKVSSGVPQIVGWTEFEWDLIGKEFMRLHPKWQTTKFTLEDVEDVMEEVIPQGKHRSFETLDDVLPQLFNAFHRIQKNPKLVINQTMKEVNRLAQRIQWTPKEWEDVVLQFNLDHPGAFDQRLAKISLRDANEASDILPLARHRRFFHIHTFREPALKCWDDLQPAARLEAQQNRVVKEFSSGVIVEPPPMKSDANKALATAMHKAFQAPEKPEVIAKEEEKPRKKMVHWDDSEWLKVCMEMRRQNPHTNYLTSSFSKIDLAAMKAAQREVLPLERRKALKQPGGLQGPLCKTFRIIKANLENEQPKDVFEDTALTAAVKTALIAAQVTAAPVASVPVKAEPKAVPAPAVVAEKVPELAPEPAVVKAVAPVAEVIEEPVRALFTHAVKEEIAEQVQGNDFLKKMLKAAMPMADVMVDELALRLAPRIVPGLIAQMLPELTKAMFPMLENAIADLKRAAMPIYVPSVAQPAPAPFTHPAHVEAVATMPVETQEVYKIPVVKTVKKPLIAMLGPLGNQISEIEAAFPEFRFTFIQGGHGIKEAASSAALFIISNKYQNGPNKSNIKKYVDPSKRRYVDGGMTSYKHLINAWKAENSNQFQ